MSERRLPDGITPRMLAREAAAAYCGMSADHFDRHVVPHVPAQDFGSKHLWDIRALDRWLDERSGLTHPSRPWSEWLGALDGDSHARG